MNTCICFVLLAVIAISAFVNGFVADEYDEIDISSRRIKEENKRISDMNGVCGDGLNWTLRNGALTITGTGRMFNYKKENVPWDCSNNFVSSVDMQEGIESIGNNAFYYCEELTSVIIPRSVVDIGAFAFLYCTNLNSITIPEKVQKIGDRAFYHCDSLMSFNVEQKNQYFASKDGVLFDHDFSTLIQFPRKKDNTTVYLIPNQTTSIGGYAFSLSSLRCLVIPSQVTIIASSAFYHCSLIFISVLENKNYKSIDGVLFGENGSVLLQYPTGNSNSTYMIPNNVTTIAKNAFSFANKLTHITIPRLTQFIGDGVFYPCSGLKAIDVDGDNLYYESIDGVLFDRNCTTLIQYPIALENRSYTVPRNVKIIGNYSFAGSQNLESVMISENSSTETRAFYDCSGLSNVTISGTVDEIAVDAFEKCDRLTNVFYLGSRTIVNNSRSPLSTLKNVCVPPDYQSDLFFGVKVTSNATVCQLFRSSFNDCFRVEYFDGSFIQQMRSNATEWEGRIVNCHQFHCDNRRGLVSDSLCKSTNNSSFLCMDNKCVADNVTNDGMWSVDIEMDNVKPEEVSIIEILDVISGYSGIDQDLMTVGIEVDERGFVSRIIIYVNEKDDANTITTVIADCLHKND